MSGALFGPNRLPRRHSMDPGAGGTDRTAAGCVLAVQCSQLCRDTSCLARQWWDAWVRHDPPGDKGILIFCRCSGMA